MASDAPHKLDPSPELLQQVREPRDSLNDQAVVDAIVRNFAKTVADEHDKLYAGQVSAEAVGGTLEAAASQAAKPFMGQDPKFATTEWHSPGQLGESLRQNASVEQVPELAVEQRFRNLAGSISDTYSAHARGAITDAEAQRAMDDHCDSCTFDLLGIPQEARPK